MYIQTGVRAEAWKLALLSKQPLVLFLDSALIQSVSQAVLFNQQQLIMSFFSHKRLVHIVSRFDRPAHAGWSGVVWLQLYCQCRRRGRRCCQKGIFFQPEVEQKFCNPSLLLKQRRFVSGSALIKFVYVKKRIFGRRALLGVTATLH